MKALKDCLFRPIFLDNYSRGWCWVVPAKDTGLDTSFHLFISRNFKSKSSALKDFIKFMKLNGFKYEVFK